MEVIHALRSRDVDHLAGRAATRIAELLENGDTADSAINRSLRDLRTSFFQVNGVARDDFVSRLLKRLAHISTIDGRPQQSLTAVLKDWVRDVESQQARALKANRGEEFLRSLLQNRLQVFGSTTREAHEGAGQTDVWFHGPISPRTIFEVKVPASKVEFEDGILELVEYAKSSGLAEAYFIFLDFCPALTEPRFTSQWEELRQVDGVDVHCIAVRVAETSPSAVGRMRRRRATPDS